MKRLSWLLFSILSFTTLPADEVSIHLLAPSARNLPGAAMTVDVLWLNQSGSTQHVHVPVTIDAVVRQSAVTWPVCLRQEGAPSLTESILVEHGGFARRSYALTLPIGARGALLLSIEQPFTAQVMFDVTATAGAPSNVPAPQPAVPASALRPVAGRLHRAVMENFGFHEPIYFLYGPDEPVAKFQLSFRYRLTGHRDSPVESDPAGMGLYLAYTQRSLWNIKEPSSPFYDTSYMPELLFESLASETADREHRVSFIGYQTGYRHESNGRDGLDSRSLDIFYVRTGLLVGLPHGWRLVIAPRLFAYLGTSSDNGDIKDYRGYGELLWSLGRENGFQLNLTAMAGRDWNKGAVQIDATYPIRIPSVHFDTFFHVQYFDGYGESLRDYNRQSSTWRAGVSLVR